MPYVDLYSILHPYTNKYDAHVVFLAKTVQCNTEGVIGTSISGFLPIMLSSIDDIRGNLSHNPDPSYKLMLDKLMEVINGRLQYLVSDNLMIAGKG